MLGSLIVMLSACHGSSSNPNSTTFNLKPLSPFPGVGDWTMGGGGPTHSGYVPVTLVSSMFSLRWKADLGSDCQEIVAYNCTFFSPVVTDSVDGHVIIAADEVVQSANTDSEGVTLYGLDESDGRVAWQKPSGYFKDDDNEDIHFNHFSDPSVSDGRIYMTFYTDIQEPQVFFSPQPPDLVVYDAKTGNQVLVVQPPCANPCNNDVYSVTQALVSGSIMYTGAPLSAFDSGNGTLLWSATLGGVGQAIGPQGLYFSRGTADVSSPAFVAVDPASGSTLFQVLPAAKESGLGAVIPVLDGMDGAVVGEFDIPTPNQPSSTEFLDHYSLTTHVRDWQAQGDFDYGSVPVVAKGVAYACDGESIDAYDVSDGIKQWDWMPAGDPTLRTTAGGGNNCSLAATNNLLFVSSGRATYAVDLNNHQSVWSYPKGGKIAISPSGILYISANSPTPSQLVAINLH